jgi:L-aminoadipate-semialdehyde dehydrogenase
MIDLVLPTDFPRSVNKAIESHVQKSFAKTNDLLRISLSAGLSPFSVIQTAFVIICSRISAQENLELGSALGGALFPISVKVDLNSTFDQLLSQIQEKEKDASSKRGQTRVACVNVMDAEESYSQAELILYVSQSASARALLDISLKLVYNSLLFNQQRMEDLLDQIEEIIHSVALDSCIEIGKIPMMTLDSKLRLPDPTADLGWDQFEGAITDVFTKNANNLPNATCVVESFENGHRIFTYRQILEASNILAHFLINHGIQRGDIVVLYSSRCVDLVVAVMGVLKAGAAFSVIGNFVNLTNRSRLSAC